MNGRLRRGRTAPGFRALDEVVPADPGADLGPFWGDALRKSLKCRLDSGGAVIYWCVDRRLPEEELESERARLGIPAGEWARRTEVRPGMKTPRLINTAPGFDVPICELPPMKWAPGRRLIVIAAEPFYREVVGAENRRRFTQLVRVDTRRYPVFAYRSLTWTTLAATLSPAHRRPHRAGVRGSSPRGRGRRRRGRGRRGRGRRGRRRRRTDRDHACGRQGPGGSRCGRHRRRVADRRRIRGRGGHSRLGRDGEPEDMTVLDVTDAVGTLSSGSPIESHVTFDGMPYRVAARLFT